MLESLVIFRGVSYTMSLNFHSFKIIVKKLANFQTRVHYLGECKSEALALAFLKNFCSIVQT